MISVVLGPGRRFRRSAIVSEASVEKYCDGTQIQQETFDATESAFCALMDA